MDPIRYRPGEALRWLETGADRARESAREKGRRISEPPHDETIKRIGHGLKNAVGAAVDFGKGAWADLLAQRADATEYVILNDRLELVQGKTMRSVKFTEIRAIHKKGDRYRVSLVNGSLNIEPYAHIVAGKVKVPIGWTRNGIEVPFELFPDELSARCGVDITEAASAG